MKTQNYYRSPLGWLELEHEQGLLTSAKLVARKPARGILLEERSVLFRQLQAYFQKQKKVFSVRLRASGTPFQARVWKALREVPYGKTASYAQIAARIGRKKSVRAVARAIGQNPLAIVVPCHRVIGSDGSLTGYAYGLRKKAWLLKHERN
jgi:methylated-DNA-[protein]-cysteine S-methyltransferase